MKKPLVMLAERGSRYVLPIEGWTVSEIRVRTHQLLSFTFSAPHQPLAQLDIAASVLTLRSGGKEVVIAWDKDKPYTSRRLAPFLDLLGRRVVEAEATRRGSITTAFEGAVTLTAQPDVWEGWHFRCGDLSLHGDDGRLI